MISETPSETTSKHFVSDFAEISRYLKRYFEKPPEIVIIANKQR